MQSTHSTPLLPSILRTLLERVPLPQLLAALDVEVVTTSVKDCTYSGLLIVDSAGQRLLAVPEGRPIEEAGVRHLLAETLGEQAFATAA